MEITAKHFFDATGREPIQDDLERVNCPHAGEEGHSMCGWNHILNRPAFEVGSEEKNFWRELKQTPMWF